MFEKEAEEWVIDSVCKDCSRYEKCKSKEHCTCKECSKEKWQDGAGFGYNKANEWHYVKDGLPETSGRYLVYTGGKPFILYFDTEVNSFGYWVVSLEDNWGERDEDFETVKDRGEDEIIAWCEIPRFEDGE